MIRYRTNKNSSFFTLLLLAGVAHNSFAESCDQYDKYNSRATAVSRANSNCESLTPELGGLRSALADNGFGLQFSFSPSYQYDLFGHNAEPQQYGGQNPNWSQGMSAIMTYDLARIGFSDEAQLTLSGTYQTSNYHNNTPHLFTVSILAINQPFFDHQLELQYGFYPLIRQFYGMILGGNSASAALGPGSVIPVQVGLSYNEPTPSFDITVRDPSLRFYNHFAVARSISARGDQVDRDVNPTGLRWDVPDADALYINELGYQRAASENEKSIWLRFGAMYNTSDFDKNLGNDTAHNYGAYLAGSFQLTQRDNAAPGKGLYFDAKYNQAAGNVNTYNRDFQLITYYIGPFDHRQDDMVSLGYSKSYYSKSKQEQYKSIGYSPETNTSAISLSYAFKVTNGLYWVSGFNYTKNPVFSEHHPDALIFQQNLNFNF